jgi:hypothetical protein
MRIGTIPSVQIVGPYISEPTRFYLYILQAHGAEQVTRFARAASDLP